MSTRTLLEDFRDLKIRRDELIIQGSSNILKGAETILICNQHLIKLLEAYRAGDIDINRILEWVNTIWFSDVFDYCDEHSDCLASIMNKLEELDEGYQLNEKEVEKLLGALIGNKEVYSD